MTDENLDKLMRKVLIDALRMEWSDALNESPTMSTTKEFQHQMKVMLRDPFAWYHKKTRDFRYIWIITSSSKGVPMIL